MTGRMSAQVRLGSEAEVSLLDQYVRSTPESSCFVPCVDGSGLARAFFTVCSIGRCSHVFGLLMRFT